jgi:hypothetical protein
MPQDENTKEELRTLRHALEDAVADIERLIWISGICRYCIHSKGKSYDRNLDHPCKVCEPKWRGPKRRKKSIWND